MIDNSPDLSKLDYPGELTLEALATVDKYISSCCNVSETSRRLNKKYIQVRKYLKQPYVREIFQLHLMRKGVTPEKIAEVISAGIQATNGVYANGSLIADEPNWMARQKFVQLAAEVFEVLKYVNKVDINQNQDIKIVVAYGNKKQETIVADSRGESAPAAEE